MEETQKSKEWLCGGCQKRFETEEKLLEHQFLKTACRRNVNLKEQKMKSQRIKDEFQELLEKDRIKNPTLALISEHLWWLALMAKLGLISMLISFSLLIMAGL